MPEPRCILLVLIIAPTLLHAAPNFVGKTDRPLRYRPDGTDFVIENGPELFNRPLYIRNSAMRVDAGDRPQFSLFLPGRGGVFRLGIKLGKRCKWLDEAEETVARYRPGEMLYELRDPILGGGSVSIRLLTLADANGYIVRIEPIDPPGRTEFIFAFGGANGDKGSRNGDIGCEKVPVSEFFAQKPAYCIHDRYTLREDRFFLENDKAKLVGIVPAGTKLSLAASVKWNSLADLLAWIDKGQDSPVVVGETKFDRPLEYIIRKQGDEIDPNGALDRGEARIKAIREKVVVDTPDPFINAAIAALNVAADGVWDDKQGVVMHGAVAWRRALLGWRGPYANDALGWHDRAERHFRYWAGKQNTDPIPSTQPGPDQSANLSRCEAALHSNGDMSHSHYDMNLVYIDALFRHLMWTGDMKMARELWPVIVRHLAWERRLFRREFGPEKLPLYEGYCDFWASDDVYYSGGGATHASAYNYWHNRMAAKIARAIGEDPAPYDHEADLIWQGMQKLLWVDQTRCFAECKDLLGLQQVHPAAAVWTVYHTIDSHACTPEQAISMTQYIDSNIAQIPIHGPGVPDENLYTIPTTNWMPYTWSTNNVVMAEAAHTSLAYWEAGRGEDAFRLFKGCVLDSMFMGLCPGNAGMCTQFDMARGETQRDFADAVGVCSRTIVEGLFGVKPDLIGGEVTLTPGLPPKWERASIRHPDFEFTYNRDGGKDRYSFKNGFGKKLKVHLLLPNRADEIRTVAAGETAEFHVSTSSVVTRYEQSETVLPEKARKPASRFETVDLSTIFNDRLTNIFKHEYLSPRSPFCSLSLPKQGIGTWCHPDFKFEISDEGLRRVADQGIETPAASGVAKRGKGILLPNGTPLATPGTGDAKNIAFVSQWDNFPKQIEVPVSGQSPYAVLMLAGTTNSMQSRFDNGEVVATYTDGTTTRLALENPTNWWPIDQDYLIDDFAFRRPQPLPIRVDLATGKVRVLDMEHFKGTGGKIQGGAATVITMPLDSSKTLKSLGMRALANDVVIGLMSVTLARN